MKIANQMWLALMLLPMLCACQADDIEGIQEEIPDTPSVEVEPVTIKASLPGGDKSRAQVKYDNQNIEAGEFFMWNNSDVITLYNYTKAGIGYINGTEFKIKNINGNNADFTTEDDFTANPGDILFAAYGETLWSDKDFIIEDNGCCPQTKTGKYDDSELEHLQGALKMYDIVKVGDDGKIPELHFKHLSALMRITLHNHQSSKLNLKKIKFNYGDNEAFVVNKIYRLGDDLKLEKSTCNSKANWESDMDITLNSYETYDLFFALVPSEEEANPPSTSTLEISFNEGIADATPISTQIQGFTGITIQPGYRYWFDLTVTDEGLKQTSMLEDYYWYNHPTSKGEYVLSSVKDLREFANLVNGTASGVDGAVDFQGKTVKIATGINTLTLNNDEAWTPIGIGDDSYRGIEEHPFKGTFDGGGCHIANLNVEQRGGYAGLFGYAPGNVRNLRVSGNVTSKGDYVGGIAGQGDVDNCIFNGKVSGNEYVGGICGESYSIYECYTTGTVTGKQYVGGILGYVRYAQVSNCYSAANVVGDYDIGGIVGKGGAEKCYSAGTVTGKNRIGGIAGSFSSASIEYCIALNSEIRIEGTENATIGRVVGEKSGNKTIESCYAYEGMKAPDGITFSDKAKDGESLSAADCLSQTTYTENSFIQGTWSFNINNPWEYLPWREEFKNFRGIQPEDYQIKVPEHLK